MANENDGIMRNNNDETSTNSMQKDENNSTKTTNSTQAGHVEPRREENPFSFKHFLKDPSNNPTTKILLQNSTLSNQTNSFLITSTSNNNDLNKLSSTTSSSPPPLSSVPPITSNQIYSTSYQTSTGARPKVPQSTSTSSSIDSSIGLPYQATNISTTSMSSLLNTETSKMKRSPRFSSFDSQASLNEYSIKDDDDSFLKDAVRYEVLQQISKRNSSTNTAVTTTAATTTTSSSSHTGINNSSSLLINNYNKMFVPRSYSNYDMDLPIRNSSSFSISGNTDSIGANSNCSIRENSTSPIIRRTSPTRANRSNSMGISSQQSSNRTTNQSSGHKNNNVGGLHCRPNSEFAAALPDFVQDHWMDPWYYNEMHLNSPPNSPNRQQSPSPINFAHENLPAGMANPPGCSSNNVGNVGNGGNEKCQTLPDFLSDGPIIHSSGRLADVAVGLPNLDSPDDNSPNLQLSRIRLENERLRRELDESRIALSEQTRRSCDLERQLEQFRSNESTFNRTLAQNIGQVEENLDQSKKQTEVAQNQVSKLKLQVKQLTAKIETLKRENESLREEGAVGGSIRIDISSQRSSRNQQLSRDLMQAASTAENNLRQLLRGVENLRLMAASIDNSSNCNDFENQNSPSAGPENVNISSSNLINEDFLSDCEDDFDDFSGPAL